MFGKVVVTKAESGLLQLSLGTKDGIEPRQLLDVLRDGKRIAQVRVVLTRENQSVGLVEPREDVQKVQKGDAVQVRASEKRAGNRLERAVANASHGDVAVSK